MLQHYPETGAADISDAWVTITTKVSLMTTEGISTKDLNVDTVNGVATAMGLLSSQVARC